MRSQSVPSECRTPARLETAILPHRLLLLGLADILFAHFILAGVSWADPLQTVTFVAGYTLTARGVAAQREIVEA